MMAALGVITDIGTVDTNNHKNILMTYLKIMLKQ